jgi:hypothetical protein
MEKWEGSKNGDKHKNKLVQFYECTWCGMAWIIGVLAYLKNSGAFAPRLGGDEYY